MAQAARLRIFFTILTFLIVPTLSVLVILFARGYRPNQTTGFNSTGIILAHSDPDGAQIYINGKLQGATNQNISIIPGQYEIEIKKDGFVPWKKTVQVVAEAVSRANASLFPSVPSLKAITSSGATIPTQSPDGSKIAFIVSDKTQTKLFTLDLNESPLGLINRDPKLQVTLSTVPNSILWSPDSRYVTLTASSSAYTIDLGNQPAKDVSDRLAILKTDWEKSENTKNTARLAAMPIMLRNILASSAANLVWSPKENKLMYTATSSAVLPDKILPPLPGSNSQVQERELKSGNVYVYDLEEDRNFKIDSGTAVTAPVPTSKTKNPVKTAIITNITRQLPNNGWSWFPDSGHVYKVDGNKIVIKEYDNQNPTSVYSEPRFNGFAAPYPSGKQILILTNLNPELSPLANLYALSLK